MQPNRREKVQILVTTFEFSGEFLRFETKLFRKWSSQEPLCTDLPVTLNASHSLASAWAFDIYLNELPIKANCLFLTSYKLFTAFFNCYFRIILMSPTPFK